MCHKLGYEPRNYNAATFNGIIIRANEAKSYLMKIERHIMLYYFNPLQKTMFARY